MKNNRLLNFLDEIRMQCRFILRAVAELDAAIAVPLREARLEILQDPDQRDRFLRQAEAKSDAVWYPAQQLIVSAAIISTLLWQKSDDAERRSLREMLDVRDASFLTNRKVRDSFVHIDQRIGDEFANQQGVTVRLHIGKPEPPHQPYRTFRRYDPTTGVLGFGDDEVNVHDLAREAARLLDQCDAVDPLLPENWPSADW